MNCKLYIMNNSGAESTLSSAAPIKANITIMPYATSMPDGIIGATLELRNPAAALTTLNYEGAIKFDNLNTTSADAFTYDNTTGTITLVKPGNYMLDWMVNLDGSEDASAISFAIKSGADKIFTFDSSLLLKNSYSGFYLLTTTEANTQIQLINNSTNTSNAGAALLYSPISLKAYLRIMRYNS